jgi:hypothetical protein
MGMLICSLGLVLFATSTDPRSLDPRALGLPSNAVIVEARKAVTIDELAHLAVHRVLLDSSGCCRYVWIGEESAD